MTSPFSVLVSQEEALVSTTATDKQQDEHEVSFFQLKMNKKGLLLLQRQQQDDEGAPCAIFQQVSLSSPSAASSFGSRNSPSRLAANARKQQSSSPSSSSSSSALLTHLSSSPPKVQVPPPEVVIPSVQAGEANTKRSRIIITTSLPAIIHPPPPPPEIPPTPPESPPPLPPSEIPPPLAPFTSGRSVRQSSSSSSSRAQAAASLEKQQEALKCILRVVTNNHEKQHENNENNGFNNNIENDTTKIKKHQPLQQSSPTLVLHSVVSSFFHNNNNTTNQQQQQQSRRRRRRRRRRPSDIRITNTNTNNNNNKSQFVYMQTSILRVTLMIIVIMNILGSLVILSVLTDWLYDYNNNINNSINNNNNNDFVHAVANEFLLLGTITRNTTLALLSVPCLLQPKSLLRVKISSLAMLLYACYEVYSGLLMVHNHRQQTLFFLLESSSTSSLLISSSSSLLSSSFSSWHVVWIMSTNTIFGIVWCILATLPHIFGIMSTGAGRPSAMIFGSILLAVGLPYIIMMDNNSNVVVMESSMSSSCENHLHQQQHQQDDDDDDNTLFHDTGDSWLRLAYNNASISNNSIPSELIGQLLVWIGILVMNAPSLIISSNSSDCWNVKTYRHRRRWWQHYRCCCCWTTIWPLALAMVGPLLLLMLMALYSRYGNVSDAITQVEFAATNPQAFLLQRLLQLQKSSSAASSSGSSDKVTTARTSTAAMLSNINDCLVGITAAFGTCDDASLSLHVLVKEDNDPLIKIQSQQEQQQQWQKPSHQQYIDIIKVDNTSLQQYAMPNFNNWICLDDSSTTLLNSDSDCDEILAPLGTCEDLWRNDNVVFGRHEDLLRLVDGCTSGLSWSEAVVAATVSSSSSSISQFHDDNVCIKGNKKGVGNNNNNNNNNNIDSFVHDFMDDEKNYGIMVGIVNEQQKQQQQQQQPRGTISRTERKETRQHRKQRRRKPGKRSNMEANQERLPTPKNSSLDLGDDNSKKNQARTTSNINMAHGHEGVAFLTEESLDVVHEPTLVGNKDDHDDADTDDCLIGSNSISSANFCVEDQAASTEQQPIKEEETQYRPVTAIFDNNDGDNNNNNTIEALLSESPAVGVEDPPLPVDAADNATVTHAVFLNMNQGDDNKSSPSVTFIANNDDRDGFRDAHSIVAVNMEQSSLSAPSHWEAHDDDTAIGNSQHNDDQGKTDSGPCRGPASDAGPVDPEDDPVATLPLREFPVVDFSHETIYVVEDPALDSLPGKVDVTLKVSQAIGMDLTETHQRNNQHSTTNSVSTILFHDDDDGKESDPAATLPPREYLVEYLYSETIPEVEDPSPDSLAGKVDATLIVSQAFGLERNDHNSTTDSASVSPFNGDNDDVGQESDPTATLPPREFPVEDAEKEDKEEEDIESSDSDDDCCDSPAEHVNDQLVSSVSVAESNDANAADASELAGLKDTDLGIGALSSKDGLQSSNSAAAGLGNVRIYAFASHTRTNDVTSNPSVVVSPERLNNFHDANAWERPSLLAAAFKKANDSDDDSVLVVLPRRVPSVLWGVQKKMVSNDPSRYDLRIPLSNPIIAKVLARSMEVHQPHPPPPNQSAATETIMKDRTQVGLKNRIKKSLRRVDCLHYELWTMDIDSLYIDER